MGLRGIHLLLTYTCNSYCDHCFLYCSPQAAGTFTIRQIRQVLDDAESVGTVEMIYFEGGEPTLFYPIMLEGMKYAREKGFKTGIVTNTYWATSEEDAEIWLRPIAELGVSYMSISNDAYHFENPAESPPVYALAAAEKLGIAAGTICIEKPVVEPAEAGTKGEPIVGGSTQLRGRAAEKLTEGLPTKPAEIFNECGDEELENPGRVHVDPFGHVHICQGIVIGNAWQKPLREIIAEYRAPEHPICGPLVKGGPAELAKEYGVCREEESISACHLCYKARLALIDRFPDHLAPRQVYGL
ncbi:MAG: radical SAM protein [Planctomycetota bacterium]|nr:MAG: radical SAM protein [Planctomycetota bacterium]